MAKFKWLDRRIACPGPYLALVMSQDEFDSAMRHLRVPIGSPWIKNGHSHATAHFLENKEGDLVCVVALGAVDGRSPIEIAGLLVHEAVHVWQEYAARIGETNPGDEQEAYAIQSIAQELMSEYARRVCYS